MRFRTALALPAGLAAALLLAPLPAPAQSNPSADQIIQSLKPSGALNGQTRGIKPVSPGQPAAAPATSAPTRVAKTEAAGPSVNLSVQFGNGSAELTPEAQKTLDELGHALSSQDLASYRFRIEGHTDNVGSRSYNKALSERRAQAVVAYLASKFGLDKKRLQPVGMGEDGPLVATPPQTPEPRNRRVQVVNIGA